MPFFQSHRAFERSKRTGTWLVCCSAPGHQDLGWRRAGIVKAGEDIDIVGMATVATRTTVTGVEMFKKTLSQAQVGLSTCTQGFAQ